MRNQRRFLAGWFFSLLAPTLLAQGVAISAKVGSTGVGGDLTVGLSRYVNLRGGVEGFSHSETRRQQEVEYKADLKLLTEFVVLDFHPAAKGFRISAGAYFNSNKVSAVSTDANTYTVNGKVYKASDVGKIDGTVDFDNKVAPYLGIGWGNAVAPGSHWRFAFDLGAYYEGSPRVGLKATLVNPALVPPGFAADLEAERLKTEDDLKNYKVYPVLAFGVSYRF
jgi:hypothetical protein